MSVGPIKFPPPSVRIAAHAKKTSYASLKKPSPPQKPAQSPNDFVHRSTPNSPSRRRRSHMYINPSNAHRWTRAREEGGGGVYKCSLKGHVRCSSLGDLLVLFPLPASLIFLICPNWAPSSSHFAKQTCVLSLDFTSSEYLRTLVIEADFIYAKG